MDKILLLFVATFVCAVFGQGQTQFSANIQLINDSGIAGIARLNYDATGNRLRVDWLVNGGIVNEYRDFTTQTRSLFCGTYCQSEFDSNILPQYNGIGGTITDTSEIINGANCTKYNVATNPVASVWLNEDVICRADLTNGGTILFSNVSAVDLNLLSISSWNCAAPTCRRKIDFSLVVDESGSIYHSDWLLQRSFLQSFARSYSFSSTEAGMNLILFSDSGHVIKSMDYNYYEFSSILASLNQTGGSTCLGCGLDAGYQDILAHGRHVTSVIILITDGINNVQTSTLNGIVANIKNAGVLIFTVGVGPNIDPDQLTSIASTIPGITTAYTNNPNYSSLPSILDALVKGTCLNLPGPLPLVCDPLPTTAITSASASNNPTNIGSSTMTTTFAPSTANSIMVSVVGIFLSLLF